MLQKNLLLKESILINLLGIILSIIFYLVLISGSVLMIINASNDQSSSPLAAYIIAGLMIFFLTVIFFIAIIYLVINLKYYNICFCENEIYIRYKEKWIARIKYIDITDYGDLYLFGCFLKVKSWDHYKRGIMNLSRTWSFHFKRDDKEIFLNLLKYKKEEIK